MLSLHEIARALDGEVKGNPALFPTPGHSPKDRGSWATLAEGAPDGVLIHSSNGGDPLAIKGQLRAAGVLEEWRRRRRVSACGAASGVPDSRSRLRPIQRTSVDRPTPGSSATSRCVRPLVSRTASSSNSFVNRRCFVIGFAFHLRKTLHFSRGKSKHSLPNSLSYGRQQSPPVKQIRQTLCSSEAFTTLYGQI